MYHTFGGEYRACIINVSHDDQCMYDTLLDTIDTKCDTYDISNDTIPLSRGCVSCMYHTFKCEYLVNIPSVSYVYQCMYYYDILLDTCDTHCDT